MPTREAAGWPGGVLQSLPECDGACLTVELAARAIAGGHQRIGFDAESVPSLCNSLSIMNLTRSVRVTQALPLW
jgi:hypothetical protein